MSYFSKTGLAEKHLTISQVKVVSANKIKIKPVVARKIVLFSIPSSGTVEPDGHLIDPGDGTVGSAVWE